jgi:pimeloyl-ACP methyl ester carboxylesterase
VLRDPRRAARHWGPLAAAVIVVAAYSLVGNVLFRPEAALAHRHGLALWRFQEILGIAIEPHVQDFVDSVRVGGVAILSGALVLLYVGPHFLLTMGMIAWVYAYRIERLAEVRNVLAIFTVACFTFQWLFPLAPPWQVPETGIAYSLAGLPVNGNTPAIQLLANPYAAFPSVHTGWAFLAAYFFVRFGRTPWRHVWWLYPGAIMLSIIATGNHFVLDIVAAVPFLALAIAADKWLRDPQRAEMPVPMHAAGSADAERWLAVAAARGRRSRLIGLRNATAILALFWDYALTVPPRMQRVSRFVRRQRRPFERRFITCRDGTRLAAWVALHDTRRPAIIIAPGLFTGKDNSVVRRRARRIHHEWGFHVMALDMRGNGESDRRPATTGWKEAEDLVDVCDALRAMAPDRIGPVGVYAESLAATAAVCAARDAAVQGRPYVDLGTVAVSGLYEPAETVRVYTQPPDDMPMLRPFARFFTFLLRRAGFSDVRTFADFHAAGCDAYGIASEEAFRRSTPLRPGMRLDAPVMVLHSADDPIVPITQLEPYAHTARATPGLGVWMLPWGHHCLHERADGHWFWAMLEAFFRVPGEAMLRVQSGTAHVTDYAT